MKIQKILVCNLILSRNPLGCQREKGKSARILLCKRNAAVNSDDVEIAERNLKRTILLLVSPVLGLWIQDTKVDYCRHLVYTQYHDIHSCIPGS